MWTYFRRKGNDEKRTGLWKVKAEATSCRDEEEKQGRLCSGVYWASTDGLHTAKGEVDVNTQFLMK